MLRSLSREYSIDVMRKWFSNLWMCYDMNQIFLPRIVSRKRSCRIQSMAQSEFRAANPHIRETATVPSRVAWCTTRRNDPNYSREINIEYLYAFLIKILYLNKRSFSKYEWFLSLNEPKSADSTYIPIEIDTWNCTYFMLHLIAGWLFYVPPKQLQFDF